MNLMTYRYICNYVLITSCCLYSLCRVKVLCGQRSNNQVRIMYTVDMYVATYVAT